MKPTGYLWFMFVWLAVGVVANLIRLGSKTTPPPLKPVDVMARIIIMSIIMVWTAVELWS
jgi:hypothetical protein